MSICAGSTRAADSAGVADWAGVADSAGVDASDAGRRLDDLRNLSIEQLADIPVTSAARRETLLRATPAAVFVISAEDIRKSGATSLPEVLRLAPNLQVARINAHQWTISARGFNSPEAANKLLVLVNGRSVYEPIGGGVLWEQSTINLEGVERIEVVSGPGGALWGANAVNGVINVITRAPEPDQPRLNVTAGDFERTAQFDMGLHMADGVALRVFANGFDVDATTPVSPSDHTNDRWRGGRGGVMVDVRRGRDQYTLKGSDYRNTVGDGSAYSGESLDARFVRAFTDGARLNASLDVDQDRRTANNLYENRVTVDAQGQYSVRWASSTVVAGAEYRLWSEDFRSFNAFYFADPKTDIQLGALFAQADIPLRNDLILTAGLKAEYNNYSGFDWLPNLRLAWTQSPSSLFWAAVSRSVRTPNRIERELQANGFLAPAPDFRSEKVVAIEAGWRGEPLPHASVSVSTFYNIYNDLRDDESLTSTSLFPLVLRNNASGSTYGAEAWAKYQLTPWWRLSLGGNLLHKDLKIEAGHYDFAQLQVAGLDPHYQAQIRSDVRVSRRLDFDVALRRIGEIRSAHVPAYTEAGAGLAWRATDRLVLSLRGQNLLHARHLEFRDPSATPPRYIPRSVFVRLRYGF